MEVSCSQCWYRNINEVLNRNKTMSKQAHQPSDLLVDLLLLIFDYLDEEDLENCEKVCLEWQKLIQSHTWKKRSQIKLKLCPTWQRYWKRIETKNNHCFLESWEKYKIVSKEMKMLYNNWQSGNFVLQLYSCSFYFNISYFFLDQNFLVLLCVDKTIMIFDRSAMKLRHKITECKFTCFKIKDGIIMCGAIETVKFYNLVTGKLVNEFVAPNGCTVASVCFGYKSLAVALSSNETSHQLTFWKIDSFCKTYFDHLQIPVPVHKCGHIIWMDEHFVIVLQRGENSSTVYIVSIKTRKIVETIFDSSVLHVRYEQGLLMMKYPSFLRVGVLSHLTRRPIQYFLDLANYEDGIKYATNSRYLALVTAPLRKKSFVTLYDIRSIKEKCHSISAFRFEIPFYVIESEMDETQLIFFGVEWGSHTPRVGVFDFGRVQPVCQHQPKSEISCSGYMNLEILDYIPEDSTGLSSERNIPFSRCVPRCVVKESRNWYESFKWPLVLSASTFLALLLIKYQKK